MSSSLLPRATKAVVTDVENGNRSHTPQSSAREKEMQIVTVSSFKLPDGWLVEERPRVSNASHVDRNYIESGTGQRFRSVTTYEGENACTATPKLMLKFSTGKQSAHGVKSFQNPVEKGFSVGGDKTTSKASIQSKHSEKANSQKKVNFGEEETVYNLTRPPAKVRWVLSGPGGKWRPFLDNSIVPESEKLKWSEAFVQSIREGYGQ